MLLKGVDGVQEVTRPSGLVVPVNVRGVGGGEGELVLVLVGGLLESKVRVTGMEEPGRPRVVSSTWHVIGGFCSGVAMVEG